MTAGDTDCRPPGGMILELEDIVVAFDGFKALNGLSFSVRTGELRCIIGPNGAGKSTMMDVVTGRIRPDSGRARFAGAQDLLRLTESEIAGAGVGRKFQKPTVFEYLTVAENLELALPGRRTFWATLRATVSPTQRTRIEQVLDMTGLAAYGRAAPHTLSHGQKQWLEIAMLLMQDPRLLLVDEPVAGMTPHEAARTAELLRSLAGSHSVIVVEHDMEFVRLLDGDVTVLHEGRVLVEGPLSEVKSDPRVVDVYLGV